MRRYGVAIIALLVPLAALASWKVLSVPGSGPGATIWIADGGQLAVATSQGAFLVEPDGGIAQRIVIDGGTGPLPMLDAFVDGRGCFAAVPRNTSQTYVVYADPSCGATTTSTSAVVVSGERPIRMRRAHGGPLYLSATDGLNQSTFLHVAPDGIAANGLPALASPISPAGPSKALGALHEPGVDVVMSGVSSPGSPIALSVDAGTVVFQQFPTGAQVPGSLAPIDTATTLLTDPAGELVRVGSLGTSLPTWNVLDAGGPIQAAGFAPHSDDGEIGLGMAGSTTAGAGFAFAVPLVGAPGESWAANPQVPTYSGVVQDVDCVASGTCAAVTDADAGNVVVYTNASKPSWNPPPVIETDAGTTVTITVSPTDPDGDPTAVVWTANAPLTATPKDALGNRVDVAVPQSATGCSQPFFDYPVTGSLSDGLKANHDTRTVTVRVLRVFSPLGQAVPTMDAGYVVSSGTIGGTVDATAVNCPVERGLGANVTMSVNGVAEGSQHLATVPGSFSFPRTRCGAATADLSAQLVDGDGGLGPTVSRQVQVLAQPPKISGVSGGPLVARCGEGATGTLTAVVPSDACSAQTITWSQQGGPALSQPTGSGTTFSVSTQDTTLENLIGEEIQLALVADAGTQAVPFSASVPITVEPFVTSHTELETPTAQSAAPLGVRVELENPTACPISSASVVEQVADAELVEGSAKIDGKPASAHLESGRVVVDGIPLGAGERHEVTFDVRPHVLGAPSPHATVVFRGVPISKNAALEPLPTSAGCSCRSASGAWETLGYALLAGFFLSRRRKHATHTPPPRE